MAGGNKNRKGGGSKGGSGGSSSSGGGTPLPDGVTKLDLGDGDRNYSFDVGGNMVNLRISESLFSVDDGRYNVIFNVNGDLNVGSLQGRQADLAALKIRRIIVHDASTRPDGFKYEASAWTADGRGATRALAYANAGFSRPAGGSAGGEQFAVVKGGKLRPDTKALAKAETNLDKRRSEFNYQSMQRERQRERANR